MKNLLGATLVIIINSFRCFKIKHSIFKYQPLPPPMHIGGQLCFMSKLFNI